MEKTAQWSRCNDDGDAMTRAETDVFVGGGGRRRQSVHHGRWSVSRSESF